MKRIVKRGCGLIAGGIFILLAASAFSAPLSEEEINARVRAVSKTLRCAVCQSESVWESNAPLAAQMRDIVRERVVAGESDDEIRAYFVSRYGDFILLKPRVHGLNRVIWFAPFLLLLFFGVVIYRKMRIWTQSTQEPPEPLDEEARRRVDEALEAYARKGEKGGKGD